MSDTTSPNGAQPNNALGNPEGGRKRLLRTSAILLAAVLLLIGGGWWAEDAGLLAQWLPATAQTASSVAAGVQAQADPMTTPGQRPSRLPGATGPLTGTLPLTATGALPGTGAAGGLLTTATPEPATATATTVTTVTPANRVTIPAVAGVKGAALVDDGGSLLATLESGDSVLLTGSAAGNTWLAATAAGESGWVHASDLIAYGLARLPQLALPNAVDALSATLVDSAGDRLVLTSSAITTTSAATATATAVSAATTATAADDGTLTLSPPLTSPSLAATVVTEGDGRLNLRAGPGTAYAILAKGENGSEYAVIGRNAAGDWLQVELGDGETGWASASYLVVAGDVDALPVQEVAAPAASPAPTPQPAVTTAVQVTTAEATGAAGDAITLVSATSDAAISDAAASAGAADGLAGTLVFQQSPGGTIYAYNLQTGDLWPLTTGFDPAISPDGSTVAFVRDGGETGLYLIDIDGSNERRIFERAALSSPKWSPDGQWIVFTRNDEGVECYQISDRMCLLPDEANKRFPMGVPDTLPLVTEYQYKLSAVDHNGDNYHDVPSLNSARAADWSDAGIVYQSSAGIQITADAEGATTTEVAFDNLNPYYSDPDLQPGGGQVVFQREGAAQTDLWVVNTDGSGMRALTQPRTTLVDTLPSNVAAAYSPDGQLIVFLSNRMEGGEAGDWHLWVMNADGSNQRQLPVEVPVDYTYGNDQVVSWGA